MSYLGRSWKRVPARGCPWTAGGGLRSNRWSAPKGPMTDQIIERLRRRAADPRLATDEAADAASDATAPLDDGSILRAEGIIGHRLPGLLRDAYRLVGDGGFGPGYGLLRLLPDPDSSDVESVIGLYEGLCSSDPEDPAWSWPAQLVPLCDWGCAIRSCVDCSGHRCRMPSPPVIRASRAGSRTGWMASSSGIACSTMTPAAPLPVSIPLPGNQ
jgi:hypothetical protein